MRKKIPVVSLSVSVDDEHLERFPEVVARVQKAGLQVERQMKQIGVLTGTIDATKVEALHRVVGVASVEAQRSVQVAPPDSEIQ